MVNPRPAKLIKKLVWHLRSPQEFFPQKEECSEEHSLSKSLSTGGTVIGEEGGFITVTKRSSVSINSLVYRLVVGMKRSDADATRYIEELAASACLWLGIDPNQPLKRQRGRPRTRSRDQDGNATNSGEVIELTLQPDETDTGKLIAAFQGLVKNTSLATLTLSKLAEMLVALRDRELAVDAELLEAYLEAANPDWRTKIAAQIGIEDNNDEKTNPWIVLGLTPGASIEEVKKAYRKIYGKSTRTRQDCRSGTRRQ